MKIPWAFRVKREAGWWAEVGVTRAGAVKIRVGSDKANCHAVSLTYEEAEVLRHHLSIAMRQIKPKPPVNG